MYTVGCCLVLCFPCRWPSPPPRFPTHTGIDIGASFFLSRNVSERDPTSVLFVQDNVDEKRVEWREKESSLWKIGSKRFVMLANRHPYILTSFHLPLFRYRLSIQSLTDRVVERVIEWNSVERRLLCAGVVETTNQPRVSLFSLLFITSISKQMVAVVVVHEEWNQRQRSVQSWMSAWATDQVPQRAGRLFFFLSLSRILDESWLFPFLIAFVWCKFFFLFTTRINPPKMIRIYGRRERERSHTLCWPPLMVSAKRIL